ncbi:hypothetical protein DFH09DRAFT_1308516 [Mycena vulgaris]|nr:hypothetical protein DFH09DRAFT_1308516 [Mycena vulgaris]
MAAGRHAHEDRCCDNYTYAPMKTFSSTCASAAGCSEFGGWTYGCSDCSKRMDADRRAQPRCWMDREINAGTIGASSLVRDPGHGLQPSPQLRRRAHYEIAWMYPIEPGGRRARYTWTRIRRRDRGVDHGREILTSMIVASSFDVKALTPLFDLDRAEADHDAVLELGSGIEDVEVPYPRRDLHAGVEAISFLQHLDLADAPR